MIKLDKLTPELVTKVFGSHFIEANDNVFGANGNDLVDTLAKSEGFLTAVKDSMVRIALTIAAGDNKNFKLEMLALASTMLYSGMELQDELSSIAELERLHER